MAYSDKYVLRADNLPHPVSTFGDDPQQAFDRACAVHNVKPGKATSFWNVGRYGELITRQCTDGGLTMTALEREPGRECIGMVTHYLEQEG